MPDHVPDEGIQIVEADRARIAQIADAGATRPREAVLRSLAAGHACTCAVLEGQLAGFSWAAEDAAYLSYGEPEERRVLSLGPGEVFFYDLHVLAPFRRRGVALAIKCHQIRKLAAAGVLRSWSLVDCWNVPSLRFQWHLGSRPERLVYAYSFGRARWNSLGPRGDHGPLARWYDLVGGAG